MLRDAHTRQTVTSLALAGLILAGWLAGHVYAVWFLHVGEQPLLAVFLFAWQAWLSVGLFIVAHDCMHGSLAPFRPWLNAAVGSLVLRLYMGFSYGRLIAKHHAHHRHSGTEGDPDFDADHPSDPARWYWTFMRRYLDWYVFWVTGALVTLYVAALLWAGGVERAMHILFWTGPSLRRLHAALLFRHLPPASPREEGETFGDAHNSRSNDYPAWASLLTCFHFGYHHEHHDNPHVPWWGLPATRRRVLDRTTASRPAHEVPA